MEFRPLNEVCSKIAGCEQSHFEQFKNFVAGLESYVPDLFA